MPRGRPKSDTLVNEIQKEQKEEIDKIDIEDMPLNSLGDYIRYNEKARFINNKLQVLRHPIKSCPVHLHPTQRVIFNRQDQPSNPLPVFLVNHLIDFKKTLIPSETYDLPLCIIDHLSAKGTAIWGWVDNPDGSKQTKKVSMNPRFSIRTVYKPMEAETA